MRGIWSIFLKLSKLDILWSDVAKYARLRVELAKIEGIQWLSQLAYRLLGMGIILCVLACALLFFYFSCAAYLNHALESTYMGYVIVCGSCVLQLLVLSLLYKVRFLRRRTEHFILSLLFGGSKGKAED